MNICNLFRIKQEEETSEVRIIRKFVDNICKELKIGEFKYISINTSGIALNRNDNITVNFYETPLLSLYINGISIDISDYERFTLKSSIDDFYNAQTAIKRREAFEEKERILKEVEEWSFDEKSNEIRDELDKLNNSDDITKDSKTIINRVNKIVAALESRN